LAKCDSSYCARRHRRAGLFDSGGPSRAGVKPIEDVESARVEALLADGMSIRDIAEETGICALDRAPAQEEARAGHPNRAGRDSINIAKTMV
jgi:hypothetical protein